MLSYLIDVVFYFLFLNIYINLTGCIMNAPVDAACNSCSQVQLRTRLVSQGCGGSGHVTWQLPPSVRPGSPVGGVAAALVGAAPLIFFKVA